MSQMHVLLTCTIVLLALGAASPIGAKGSTKEYTKEQLSKEELRRAFKELEDYLYHRTWPMSTPNVESAYRSALKLTGKPKSLLRRRESHLQKGAKIFAHVAHIDQCDMKAIDYMAFLAIGRPGAKPKSNVERKIFMQWWETEQLDDLVDIVLRKSMKKCQPFVANLFEESEKAMDETSKLLLYDLLNPEAIRSVRGKVVDHWGQLLVNASLRQQMSPSPSPSELVSMDAYDLYKFYSLYLTNNFLSPCKSYLAAMTSILELIGLYRNVELPGEASKLADMFGSSHAKLEHVEECEYRYDICKVLQSGPDSFVDTYARAAANIVHENRYTLLAQQ